MSPQEKKRVFKKLLDLEATINSINERQDATMAIMAAQIAKMEKDLASCEDAVLGNKAQCSGENCKPNKDRTKE